jgi:lysophospholipase L1-like esterase
MFLIGYLIIVVLVLVIVCELLFLSYYRRRHGHPYKLIRPGSIKEYTTRFKSYPYLPFIQRPYFKIPVIRTMDPRPFADKTFLPQAKTNELGLVDLCNPEKVTIGHAEISILCLGTSVTSGIDQEGGRLVSYPLVLQEILECRLGKSVQVITAGIDGWLSSELLIYSQLRLLDLKPDLVIIYHGANDVLAMLSPNFQPDYVHYRRQISEVLPSIRARLFLSKLFPFIPFLSSYEYALRRCGLRFHPIYDMSKVTRPNQPDPARSLEGLWVERRNLGYLINSIQLAGAQVLISSYVYWQYDSSSRWQAALAHGVQEENKMLRELAFQRNCLFVDLAKDFPKNREFLIDEMHFKAQGMKIVAEKFAVAIEMGFYKANGGFVNNSCNVTTNS